MELAFPEVISPIVLNMYENLHYESSVMNRYISKSYTTSKNTIGRQYTERGQLWCQLLLVIYNYSRLPIIRTFKGNRKKGSSYRKFKLSKVKLYREMKIASSQREVRVIVAQNQRVAYKLASQEYLGCTRDQPMPGPFPAPPIF